MAYIGGKSKAHWLYQFLNNSEFNNMDYIEPFVGMANVLHKITNKRSYTASDNEPIVVNLLQNIQKDNFHYEFITREEYLALRNDPSIDFNKACYAAYTYCYLGKKWDSYFDRRYKERKKFYSRLYNSISFQNSTINHQDYICYENVNNSIIYCDPPYLNANYYNNTFSHEQFWEWVREMSQNNYIFISEYVAPDDLTCILQKKQTVSFMRNKGQERIEKIFVYNDDLKKLFGKEQKHFKSFSFPTQLELLL